jgi:hypothetical protein
VNPKKGCCRKRAVESSVAKEAADREKNPSSNGRDEAQHAIKDEFLISGPELILDAASSCQMSRGNKVRFWHLADIDADAEHVGFWG